MVNPKCVECGVEVEVEGYDELKDVWKRMLDETIRCEEHGANQEKEAEELREMKRTIYATAVGDAGFPVVLRGLNWSDMDQEEPEDVMKRDRAAGTEKLVATAADATKTRQDAIAAAKRWAQGEIKGLVLAGRVGLGKSRLAAVAAQSLIYHRVAALTELGVKPMMPIRWVSVPELIRHSRGDYGTDERREAEKIMAGTSGLVLDDIDKVKPTEFALDLLFESVDGRANADKPLLVTTNMRFPELEKLLGSPLASRIAGYCEGHRMIGEDRRGS